MCLARYHYRRRFLPECPHLHRLRPACLTGRDQRSITVRVRMKPQWAAPSVVVEPDGAGGRRESEAAAEEPRAGPREVGASDSVTRT